MAPIFHDPHFTVCPCPDATCAVDLQVFCREDSRVVAVASHLPGEEGLPAEGIAHMVEAIANKLACELGYEFDYLIEHYPVRQRPGTLSSTYSPAGLPETFDLVQLQWEPAARRYHSVATNDKWPWKHLDRCQAEAIIGEPFFVDFLTM